MHMLNVRITQARRMLLWLMLASLSALMVYFALRGYLSPELLLNFSNGFTC
jgi:cytochrome c oxidase subunit IV